MALTVIVAALLLHAVGVHGVTDFCPAECLCVRQLKADCSLSPLGVFPMNLSINTRVLNFSHSKLANIKNSTFINGSLSHLKVIYLHNNNIVSIHEKAFSYLSSVIFVYLENNQIRSLHRNTFINNTKLEVLKLNENPLKIKREFLKIPSLRHLDISSCNISNLPVNTFTGLSKLEELRMSHNLIHSLDKEMFKPLQSLKYLYLSHNNFTILQSKLFSSLNNLTVLDLSNNRVVTLDTQAFYAQTSLEVLYLFNNELTVVDEDEFHSLFNLIELHLQGNKIRYLGKYLFRSLINLKALYLENNSIDDFNQTVFSMLTNVYHIHLSGNPLRTFSMKLVCDLPKLHHLWLLRTQMECDCDLRNLWDWARSHDVNLWTSCPHERGATVSSTLRNLTCNTTACFEPSPPVKPTDHQYWYWLGAIALLLLISITCVAWLLARRRRAREPGPAFDESYLRLNQIHLGHLVVNGGDGSVDTLDIKRVRTAGPDVSPYKISPVIYGNDCSFVVQQSQPPPIPARPPEDSLPSASGSASRVPMYTFSTSEEEESKPLVCCHVRPVSREASLRSLRARKPRVATQRRMPQLSSDTEPWSSPSDSNTDYEMALGSDSEASTHPLSEGNEDVFDQSTLSRA